MRRLVKRMVKRAKEERGAETIEFLAMLPIYGILFLFFLQVFFLGISFILSQHAANEAAKAYAITGNAGEAEQIASSIVGGKGPLMEYGGLSVSGGEDFNLSLHVNYKLPLLKFLFPQGEPVYPIEHTAHGRKLL